MPILPSKGHNLWSGTEWLPKLWSGTYYSGINQVVLKYWVAKKISVNSAAYTKILVHLVKRVKSYYLIICLLFYYIFARVTWQGVLCLKWYPREGMESQCQVVKGVTKEKLRRKYDFIKILLWDKKLFPCCYHVS